MIGREGSKKIYGIAANRMVDICCGIVVLLIGLRAADYDALCCTKRWMESAWGMVDGIVASVWALV